MLEGDTCSNRLCSDPNRRITRIQAIAYLSGSLHNIIISYKYSGRQGWSLIFGRLLVAWLDQYARDHRPDLIIANPTYLGDNGKLFGHTERVIAAADAEDVFDEWPFDTADPPVLVKTRLTSKSAGKTAAEKRAAADELESALQLSDNTRTNRRRILVYDDVCTTGSQLNAVAGYLIDEGGAAEVEGIVLARAPWRV